MQCRSEFDPVHKILLLRSEGRITDDLLAELYQAIRKYSIATDASAGIWDFSPATQFAIAAEFVCQLARQEPAMPNATRRPRIIAVMGTHGCGMARMFQILGEPTRPLLLVARSLDEAFGSTRRSISALRTFGLPRICQQIVILGQRNRSLTSCACSCHVARKRRQTISSVSDAVPI